MVSRRTLLQYALPTAAGGAIVALVGNPLPAARRLSHPPVGASAREPFRRTITSMGTFVSVTVYDGPGDHVDAAVESALLEVQSVDRLMSVFRPDSDLSRLNGAAGHRAVGVDPAVCDVLEAAVRLGCGSNGRFDVTVLPLLRLFGLRDGAPAAGAAEARRPPRMPTTVDLAKALELVDYRRMHVDRESGEAGLDLAGTEIDLGGIAKGYAVDRAAATLREHGIKGAVIDAGGDLYAMGAPADGDGWPIGIRDPLRPGRIAATVTLRDQAIATSGNTEHFVTVDGDRYGHLFDPAAGTPIDPVASASVIAPTAMQADALSTTAYLMGLDEGTRFVDATDGGKAVFVTADDRGDIEVHGAR